MTRRGTSGSWDFWRVGAISAALLVSGAALAQDEAAEGSADAAELSRIAVTGSRIKRTDIEGPAPVIVIDQEQLNERGYTTVYEALSDLTINNGFKFEGPENTNGFSPDVQTLNLRGFGVGETLVLINGRRLTNYPAAYQSNATVFNYGSIPVAAIERIEILATGASAIYGSDAVAGVINIILRQDIENTTIDALWGTPTETDSTRGDTRLQLVTGKTYNRGSYTLTAEYANRKAILGRFYNDYDNQQDDYPYGQGVYNRSILVLDQFKNAFGFPNRYREPGQGTGVTGQAACDGLEGGYLYAYRAGAGNFCTDPNAGVPATNFLNQKESFSAYFNGQLEIGDKGTELFADVLYYSANSKSNNDSIFLFEDILNVTQEDSVGFGFYDWTNSQIFWNSESLGGLDLNQHYSDDAWTIVTGARGVFGQAQDWEVSVNYSKYKFEFSAPWLKWRETIDNLLGYNFQSDFGNSFFGSQWWSGGTLPGEELGFGIGIPENIYGQPNAAVLDAIGTTSYDNDTSDLFLQYTMSGDLYEMKAGPLSYALVLEYEDEDMAFIPDELLLQAPPTTDAYGNPVAGLTGSGWYNLTGYNGKGDRQRWSIGGELRIPIVETLMFNVAGRYDHYDSQSSSIGGDFTPSFSLEYRPISTLLLRGGYTSSFTAPDLALVFLETGFFTQGFDYVQCQQLYEFQNGTLDGFDTEGCDPVSLFVNRVGAQTVGLEALDAETGHSWWLGFSWDILDSLNVTFDYTNMSLDQRVAQQSVQGLLNDDYSCYIGEQPTDTPCDQIGNQIVRADGASGVSFIEDFFVTTFNQYEQKGEFIDITLNYDLLTEFGTFNFEGAYNNILALSQKLTPESEKDDLKNDPITGGWQPRSSFAGSVTWSYHDFATTLTMIYRGSTTVYNCTTARNGCISNVTGENYLETENWWLDSYTTFNWTASYNWSDDFETSIRVVNLFDEKPPKDDTMDFFDNPWYNTFVYPGAGIGRYFALQASYTF